MKDMLDTDTLDALLTVARDDPDTEVRITALDAASRFPLTPDGWHAYANVLHGEIFSHDKGSNTRRAVLELAVRAPLLSVRRQLCSMTTNPDEPDADIIADALARAGDLSMARQLLDKIRSGRVELLEQLAAMKLEDTDILSDDIPPPPEDVEPDARLWYALSVARVGNFKPLDDILHGDGTQDFPMFRGDPWTPYDRIAAIRPLPEEMRDHLLNSLPPSDQDLFGDNGVRSPIVWAATGIADAEGYRIAADEDDAGEVSLEQLSIPSAKQVNEAIATSESLFDPATAHADKEVLAFLPEERVAPLVKEIIRMGNQAAAELPPEMPAEIVLGNDIVDLVGILPHTRVCGDGYAKINTERYGDLAGILSIASKENAMQNAAYKEKRPRQMAVNDNHPSEPSVVLVAGAGFEPTTFGL